MRALRFRMESGKNADLDGAHRPLVPALRVVHLAGGLRAIDLNQSSVRIEVSPEVQLGSFPTPSYPNLFQVLTGFGFHPIGADFYTNHADSEGSPPDWQAFHPSLGCYALDAERAWSGVRNAAGRDNNAALEILASKARTYLRLLPLRLRQLSEAYNLSLSRAITGRSRVPIGNHFRNEWSGHIDAAVHAFLSDAAAFRDVLSEIVWKIILSKNNDMVTSLSGLLKRTKSERHPLLISIHESAKDGWLFQLTDLRNHIVHVAPVADSQEHHMCELRGLKSPSGMKIPTIHMALLQQDGLVRKPVSTFVDYSDEEAVKLSLKTYLDYVSLSRDALSVCEEFCIKLVSLSMAIKKHGGLEEREIVITDDDIVGPIEFY